MDLMDLMKIKKAEENLKILQEAVIHLDIAFFPPPENKPREYRQQLFIETINKLNI